MKFSTLSEVNLARCERWHSLDSWSLTDWLIALTGEVGEAMNAVKKLKRIDTGIANKSLQGNTSPDVEAAVQAVAEELADVVIYLDLYAARDDVRLGSAMDTFLVLERGASDFEHLRAHAAAVARTHRLSRAALARQVIEALAAISVRPDVHKRLVSELMMRVDWLACHLDIDLERAVRSKFNQVSELYGFPERLQ